MLNIVQKNMKSRGDSEFQDIRSVISNWESKTCQTSMPRATRVSREIKKKHKSSVLSEHSDKIFSTISKRLCSLVNTNSKKEYSPINTEHSSSFSIVPNNSRSADSKDQSEYSENISKLKNHSIDQDHSRLRDFLKQISVEKNGLMSSKEKSKRMSLKKQKTLQNSISKNENGSELGIKGNESMKMENRDEIINERGSRRSIVKETDNRGLQKGDIPKDRDEKYNGQSLRLSNLDISDYNEDHNLTKLNNILTRFSKNKNELSNTKKSVQSFKCSPDQTNNDNTFRASNADNFMRLNRQGRNKFNDEFRLRGKYPFSRCDGDSSQMTTPNLKTRMTFTKKLFRIFSQSGCQYETKKQKFIFDSTNVVTSISLDNIINLITILSVEYVKIRKMVSVGPSKLESTKIHKDVHPFKHSTNGLESVQPFKEREKSKKVLSFDINGRFIRDDALSPSRLSNPNHVSWSNLYSSRLQSSLRSINSSTLSISNPRSRGTDNTKSLRIAFNSRDREPLKLQPKSASTTRLSPRTLTGIQYKKGIGSDQMVKEKKELVTVENGTFGLALPIFSDFDFLKLNDLFLLKDDLYSQYKSVLRVKPNDKTGGDKINNERNNVVWFLYIEGATKDCLNRSLQLTSSRFPEWNLLSYIDD